MIFSSSTSNSAFLLFLAEPGLFPFFSELFFLLLSWLALILGRPLSFFWALSSSRPLSNSFLLLFELLFELVNSLLFLLKLLNKSFHQILQALYFLAEGFLYFSGDLCCNTHISVKPDFATNRNPFSANFSGRQFPAVIERLHADDVGRIGKAISWNWPEFWHALPDSLGRQGRPLHDGLIHLFSFLGFRIGGLHTIYLIGYIILTVNSFLFYALLKRLSQQSILALTGALTFSLFPVHTTQIWLTILLGVQPSLTFFLIATHCYLSGRKKLSYLVILGSLLCYETFFPVFLAVPLLKKKWDARLIREIFSHVLVLGSILVCIIIIRKLTGESRVDNLNILTAIRTSILHMLVGPIISLTMFLYRPIEILKALNREMLVFLPLYFTGLVWILSRLKL